MPMQRRILRLTPSETARFQALVRLLAEVFEHEPFTMPPVSHLHAMLQSPGFIAIAATENQKVIGGLTAHVLPSCYREAPSVYLYDIAVHPDWQRQGLGGQLVAALHSEARGIGAAEVFVQADVEDDHALAFYRALRGREARVRHYTFELTSSL